MGEYHWTCSWNGLTREYHYLNGELKPCDEETEAAPGGVLRTGFNSGHTILGEKSDVVSEQSRAQEVRLQCRSQQITTPTCNLGNLENHVQVNVVIVPQQSAFSFLLFCLRNPQGCPLLEVLDPGSYGNSKFAKDLDIRSDLPRYFVYKDGVKTEERLDIEDLWQDDFVTFLLGCSFSWEDLLAENGLCPRQIEEKKNVPMYTCTKNPNNKAGEFGGYLVVSMRPYLPADIQRVIDITKRFPGAHGAPVHFGDPGFLGIRDINVPDYGDSVTIKEGELPVFWACGVTTQEGLQSGKLPLAITHAPGHMGVLDLFNSQLEVSS